MAATAHTFPRGDFCGPAANPDFGPRQALVVGTVTPTAVECKRENNMCCSLREKPSLHLRWKQTNKPKAIENPQMLHRVFLPGGQDILCFHRLQSQASEAFTGCGAQARQPVPLRPNAVANRSSVSLGVCPSVGPEIISSHRIMSYWELRRMWEGRQGPLICRGFCFLFLFF